MIQYVSEEIDSLTASAAVANIKDGAATTLCGHFTSKVFGYLVRGDCNMVALATTSTTSSSLTVAAGALSTVAHVGMAVAALSIVF